MKLKTLAALALSMAGTAHAGIYVVGHTVQPCAEKGINLAYANTHECRVPSTQKRVNHKYRDDYGNVKVANIPGSYYTQCDTDGTCVVKMPAQYGVGKRDEAHAQIAVQREAAMAKLKGYTEVETAYEIYQWSVSKNKEVYLSYVGIEINYANGEQEDRSDPNGASRHLRAVLNDSFDTYEKYVRAGLPGGSIKRDPQLLWLIY